jgi:hypothetical protein
LQSKLHDQQLTQSIVGQLQPASTGTLPVNSATVSSSPTPITQEALTAAYQQGAQAATQYQLPMLAQTSLPSAYPSYSTTTPVVATSSGVNQMLPYIAIGGIVLVALLAKRS